tara:strand:- start:60 stop:224 length:165 start_codon:yes stop_codon:yes gene_type:complete
MKTKYYEIQNNAWVQSELSANKLNWHWIKLYDDNLNVFGIGMYPKNTIKQIKEL